MNDKWEHIGFEQRLMLLRDMSVEDIKKTYGLTDHELQRAHETAEILTVPKRGKALKTLSAAPDKRSLREAGRDFNATLIFAELIDNSIDRFCKDEHSDSDTLRVTIRFDRVMNSCIYEDNAGGFSAENVVHFFKPGGTDNLSATHSIGSYAWGAKKARSALADSVELISRPQKGPSVLATIDDSWDQRDEDWSIRFGIEGKDFTLSGDGMVAPGTTRLVFKNLKPLVAVDAASLKNLRQDLGEIYSLFLSSHRDRPCTFTLDLQVQEQRVIGQYNYHWTAYCDEENDLQPRRYVVTKEVVLPFISVDSDDPNAKKQSVQCILEIGLKTDTGPANPAIKASNLFDPTDDWGIDVYGNCRLLQRNVRQPLGMTDDIIGGQQASKLVKGRLIIIGSSYSVPWDTHKTRIAFGHPTLLAINEAFAPIVQAYVRAARIAGRSQKAITTRFRPSPWQGKYSMKASNGRTISLAFDLNSRPIDFEKQPTLQLPRAKRSSKNAANGLKTIRFQVTLEEQNNICRWLECDEKTLAEHLKRRILRAVKSGKLPGEPAEVSTAGFRLIRDRIRDPRLLSKLQTAGLTSIEKIKAAGSSGLAAAGLTEIQTATVIDALGL